jgi:hypothetical protein
MYALLFAIIFQGLAVWALCCVVEALLDLIPIKNNALQILFGRITSPILTLTRLITPALAPKSLHIYLAALWLLTARVVLYLGAGAYGLLPSVTL